MSCECGNTALGFNCMCQWMKDHPGTNDYNCQWCGLYTASKARCSECSQDKSPVATTPTEKVFQQLMKICTSTNFDDRDREVITSIITGQLKHGWTEEEMFQYLKNCEEINPNTPEDIAIQRMNTIRIAVEKRLKENQNANRL